MNAKDLEGLSQIDLRTIWKKTPFSKNLMNVLYQVDGFRLGSKFNNSRINRRKSLTCVTFKQKDQRQTTTLRVKLKPHLGHQQIKIW